MTNTLGGLNHRDHIPTVVLDVYRTEAVAPYGFIVEFARCQTCMSPIQRTQRYGAGADGDTGWTLAP